MLGLYALLIGAGLHIYLIIVMFGSFVALTMFFVLLRHRANQREFDAEATLPQAGH
jgi:hypothetical protein